MRSGNCMLFKKKKKTTAQNVTSLSDKTKLFLLAVFLERCQDKCKLFWHPEGVTPVHESLGCAQCHLLIAEPGQCLAQTGDGETHPARAANNQQRQETALHQLWRTTELVWKPRVKQSGWRIVSARLAHLGSRFVLHNVLAKLVGAGCVHI